LLKLPWLIKILDDGAAHQFWSSLEEFLSFANFKHRKFGSTRSATSVALFLGKPNGKMA